VKSFSALHQLLLNPCLLTFGLASIAEITGDEKEAELGVEVAY
jgi:hypothetical protein